MVAVILISKFDIRHCPNLCAHRPGLGKTTGTAWLGTVGKMHDTSDLFEAWLEWLLAKSEFGKDSAVSRRLGSCEELQQTIALANHLQQPPARRVIFFMSPEMLSQVVNPRGKQRYLHVS